MKIKCSTQKLRDTLSIATLACGGNSMPILSTVLIVAKKDRVFITGNTLDVSISASFPAEVAEPGGVCIAGKRFQGIVAAMPTEDCAISTTDSHRLDLKSGSSHFKLMGLCEDEFPKPRAFDGGFELKMEQAALLAVLTSVACAQSDDPTRYLLNAVCMEVKDKKLAFVATDGRRLHANHSIMEASEKNPALIIPSPSVDKIMALLGESGSVTITCDAKAMSVEIDREDGDVTLITKLIEGNYPNWRLVLTPEDKDSAITVNREELIAALKRVRLALDEKNTSVRIEFEGMGIKLTASSPSNGDSNETVTCKNPANVEGKISVKAGFLIESLSAVDSETVLINVDAKKIEVSPITISNETVRMIIMPVRLS